jgi:prepilin-type N-terminal cleavage/methylation domain-containing protein
MYERLGFDDRGDTLIEILVALAILSIGIVALVGAIGANASATSVNRQQAQVDSVLLSAAEYVKSVPLNSALCSAPVPFDANRVPRPAGYTVTFGTLTAYPGQVCPDLATVAITVTGDGFTLPPLTVLKRSS